MNQLNNTSNSGSLSCDVLVVGAGVLGLWVARHAALAGAKVIICEKREVGAGGSGGFLGALMPHMPDGGWQPKKQMQYEALCELPEVVASLESDTGGDCGFRRCGRLVPMTHYKMPENAKRRVSGAEQFWLNEAGEQAFIYENIAVSDVKDDGWMAPDIASFGATFDDFSARINPRSYLAALKIFAEEKCQLIEGAEIVELNPGGKFVTLSDGSKIQAERTVVTSGYEAYPMLQPMMGEMNDGKPIGKGVKGQAVLVQFDHDDTMPIVYHDRSYVVPHKGNIVAIGSTSQSDWSGDASKFDDDNMNFYNVAMDLVPALVDAPIIGKWAGVRPRNTLNGRGTDPFYEAVPGADGLYAVMGGFKITLGIGHEITRRLVTSMLS
ncbi:MAG: FAD-binding oxidoreductase [Rhizobiaceae bacterium]|nr:FAD-binding oxidoreductase [Rhizobiaceae bacterium]